MVFTNCTCEKTRWFNSFDFRKLNGVTTPDPYCMPLVEDLLDRVGSCEFLSKIDLTKRFYQIPIREEDRDKTAFCSPHGK